jgi:predicted NAD-dependent protein-ADP-ribosyltransferase YbiA (DUF1768 family)
MTISQFRNEHAFLSNFYPSKLGYEGNTWNDRFWGVCRGSGLNHLGRILMEVRAEVGGCTSM